MFCSKCGIQLPEDARFCNHCGSPVAQQMNYRQPQYYTAPYTLPLDASPEAKAQAQFPNYTVPLDGAAARPYPQYTAPVDPDQACLHTAPVENAPAYNPAHQPQTADPHTPPKSAVSGSVVPRKTKPKNIVMRVAIAVGVALALVYIFYWFVPLRWVWVLQDWLVALFR